MSNTTDRLTIRDLPLPAKLVLTTFLLSVGLGYLWAMAQIHFKHASLGEPMPTLSDLVSRFSGVPWPIEPKPEAGKQEPEVAEKPLAFAKPGVRVKTIIDTRCTVCHKPMGKKSDKPTTNFDELTKNMLKANASHPKGRMYTAITGERGAWDRENMVDAFFEESVDWKSKTPEQRKAIEPQREAERRALIAWIDAGATQTTYEGDAFPLPAGYDRTHLKNDLLVELDAAALAMGRGAPRPKPPGERTPLERWNEAESRQINVESLTQSTHAHLLSFAMLWAFTGLIFAFSNNSHFLRCVLSPIVLIAQVLDVSCWWLARLEGVGPYFAIAILGTGAVVGLGLGAQITLSLWSMYGKKGRCVLLLMALIGGGLFGLAFVKVIKPQLADEQQIAAQQQGK